MARAGCRPARAFAASRIDVLKAKPHKRYMGRDDSGRQPAPDLDSTRMRSTVTSVTVDVGALWGPGAGGVGVGGAYCDCAQVVLELWGRMIRKVDCDKRDRQ